MRKVPDELQAAIVGAFSVDDLLVPLEHLLSSGYNVRRNGDLYFIKKFVARFKGLSNYVYPEDHPPPHFHIRGGGGVDVTFASQGCDLPKVAVQRRHYGRSTPALGRK